MPIGLVVADGTDSEGRARFENSSNSDGTPRGRELELAELLGSKRDGVKNTVWLTADVHCAAAHVYNPERAQFNNFDPFWEFVAGPINAAALDPKPIDNTFGPEVVFQHHPVGVNPDRSPRSGLQFFGEVNIAGRTADFMVRLRNRQGVVVFTRTLTAT